MASPEETRLQTLHEYEILDTPPEAEFDGITFLASQICNTPFALVSLVDAERVWFKSKVGFKVREIPRARFFCSEAIKQKELFLVEDARKDARFASLPVVLRTPRIRFYAGAPLIGPKGKILGMLCVLDKKPRKLKKEQKLALRELSRLVISNLELRRNTKRLKRISVEKNLIEKELSENQEQYKYSNVSAGEIFYRTDERGFITSLNSEATNLLKYGKDELEGRHYLEIVDPRYRKSTEKFYSMQFLMRIPKTYHEVPVLAKDSQIVWLGQSVHLLFQNEQIAGFSVVAHDITERKLAGEQVAKNERHLVAVINNVSEGITFCDESGFFEVFNSRMEKITGYTIKEANDTPDFNKLLYPDEDDYRRVLITQKELLASGRCDEFEITIFTKLGEKKTCLVSLSLVPYKDQKMVLSVYRDITEWEKNEQAFRAGEKRFYDFFESNPLPCWLFDSESLQFIEVNSAALQHYGYTKEEFLAMNVMDLRPVEDIPNFRAMLEAIRLKEYKTAQGKHRRKDGSIIDVVLNWYDFEHENRRTVLVIAQDVTESKWIQEELQRTKEAVEVAYKAKSEFLANMSHEIRTPMNGIVGTIDLLFRTTLSQEQREYAETIRLSGDALLNVLNDILDFTKIESHEVELEEHPFRIETCIEEIFELYAVQADQKGIDLVYWIDENVPYMVVVDATRLRQILVNIVSNAIKFTEQGEIYITVSKTLERAGKIELLFSVRDTGIGIPPDRVHRLFKPFSQVDSSFTRRYGGAGLGLAICARAVDLLGGQIWVESKIDEGSTFLFTLNLSEYRGDPQSQNLCPLLTDKSKNAIIIDDNTTCRKTLGNLVAEWGFSVQSAATLEPVLDLVRKGEKFDVVVAEQTSDDYSGLQLRKMIREESGKHDTAFVILALRARRDLVVRENDEALQVVLKPFRHQVLYNAVKELLKQPMSVSTPVAAVETVPQKSASQNVQATLPSMNILVAEDNAINQKLIVRILKILGTEVDIANNGLEALNAARQKKYDIVFMDIQMPVMDGYEATRHIRNDIPTPNQPVIIAMTANALQGDREKCLEAGMNDYMSKPILIDEVKRIVQKWHQTIHNQT